jgi:hypothetical protein
LVNSSFQNVRFWILQNPKSKTVENYVINENLAKLRNVQQFQVDVRLKMLKNIFATLLHDTNAY